MSWLKMSFVAYSYLYINLNLLLWIFLYVSDWFGIISIDINQSLINCIEYFFSRQCKHFDDCNDNLIGDFVDIWILYKFPIKLYKRTKSTV